MSSEPGGWLRPAPDGVLLAVHVVPGSSRSAVAGLHGDQLRVRVAAPPADGAANRALVELIAGLLEVRPGAVSIERGGSSRRKVLRVRGVQVDGVRQRLLPAGSVDTPEGRH